MRGPGTLAIALLFRRLTRELASTNSHLAKLVELEEKRLKMDAVTRNFPLAALDDLEEVEREKGEGEGGEPQVLSQSDSELAALERLEKTYIRIHGRAPDSEEDLVELKKGKGALSNSAEDDS